VELVAVGDAHEVAVPHGLKVQALEPDFESGWEGSELPMEYLWDLYSVRITIEKAGGKLISAQSPYLVRQLSVRKVVPTLTSKSTEIYLSMAGAKQHNDMGLPWFRPQGRMSSMGALGALYCVTSWCLQRRATSKAGQEGKPPGP
jgi:hypothetical protein